MTLLTRLVVIVAVVWLVATTVIRYREMMAGPVSDPTEVASSAVSMPVSPASILSELPPAGYWTFADWNWTVGQQQVKATEVEQLLNQIKPSTPETLSSETVQAGADASDWRPLLRQLGMEQTTTGATTSYRLQQNGFKVYVQLKTVAEKDHFVTVRLAFPAQDDNWIVLTFTPTTPRAGTLDQETSLLPLPGAVQRVCTRWAQDNSLLLEFLAVDTRRETLLKHWSDAGWQPRPVIPSESENFAWLCTKQGREVYAWIPESRSSVRHLLLVDTTSPTTSKN